MSPVRVLGLCGFLAGILSTIGGFTAATWMIGLGSLIMLAGNLFALVRRT